MAPKKQTKMSLNDFLADQTKGSWADDTEELPSAPSADSTLGRYERQGGSGYGRESGGGGFGGDRDRGSGGGDRSGNGRGPREYQNREYTPRRDVPLPTEPPYTAHMGNLPFDLGDEDVASFFTESKVKSVRILKDRDERPKGFGYVEFDDLESLKNAIKLSGESLGGRTVRISVAEPPKERDDRTDNMWRRDGPPPSLRDPPPERERGFGASRGGFGGGGGGGGGGFRERNFSGEGGREERSFSSRSTDTEWRGGAFAARREASGAGPDSFDRENTPSSPTSPAQRKKLELKPRSIPSPASPAAAVPSEIPSPTPTSATLSKPRNNPFGNAKPIDSEAALKRVEERRAQEQKAREEKRAKAKEAKALEQGPKSPRAVDAAEETNDTAAPTSVPVAGVAAQIASKPTSTSNGFAALSIDDNDEEA